MDNQSTSTVIDVSPQRSLRSLAEEAYDRFPVVRLDDGADAVVVAARHNVVELLVLPVGNTRVQDADRVVTVITDPTAQAALLRQAMRMFTDRLAAVQIATTDLRREHARTLSEIRDYAVARHTDGEFCREGLNKFLEAFSLELYQPTVRVRFVISGSYDVHDSERDSAERDGRGYLKPNLDDLDRVVEDSASFEVSIDDVEEIS